MEIPEKSTDGVSMNTIVFRTPNHVYIGNVSEHELGGIAVNHGGSWRFDIPEQIEGKHILISLNS